MIAEASVTTAAIVTVRTMMSKFGGWNSSA